MWGIVSVLNSLQLFCDKERTQLKEATPEAKFGELNALLAAKWKEVSDADKKAFQTMHEVRAPSNSVDVWLCRMPLVASCCPLTA